MDYTTEKFPSKFHVALSLLILAFLVLGCMYRLERVKPLYKPHPVKGPAKVVMEAAIIISMVYCFLGSVAATYIYVTSHTKNPKRWKRVTRLFVGSPMLAASLAIVLSGIMWSLPMQACVYGSIFSTTVLVSVWIYVCW